MAFSTIRPPQYAPFGYAVVAEDCEALFLAGQAKSGTDEIRSARARRSVLRLNDHDLDGLLQDSDHPIPASSCSHVGTLIQFLIPHVNKFGHRIEGYGKEHCSLTKVIKSELFVFFS